MGMAGVLLPGLIDAHVHLDGEEIEAIGILRNYDGLGYGNMASFSPQEPSRYRRIDGYSKSWPALLVRLQLCTLTCPHFPRMNSLRLRRML
jgi:hypothetical protein